jgi:hypothetical protein
LTVHTAEHIVWGMAKDPAAVSLGRKGGNARSKKLTPARRKEIASKAAQARWKKGKNK